MAERSFWKNADESMGGGSAGAHTWARELGPLLRPVVASPSAVRRSASGEVDQAVEEAVLHTEEERDRLAAELEQAESMLRRALPIEEERHGVEHSATAEVLCRLGSVLQEQGKLSEAESTFRKVIVIFEQAYGPSHEKTMGAHNNLALVLHDARRYGEAEAL